MANPVAVVIEKRNVRTDLAVTDAKRGRRELGADRRIDVRVVARVRGQRAGSQQGRQELVVGDRLNLADHDLAGLQVDLLVGERAVRCRDLIGDPIVLADEQRLQDRLIDVFIRPDVAGQE